MIKNSTIFVVRISFINAVNRSSYGCRRIHDIRADHRMDDMRNAF